MAVYTDKKSGRYYVKFDFKCKPYFKRLPQGITKRKAEQFETAWKAQLFFDGVGFKEQRNMTFDKFLVKVYLPFSLKNKKSHALDLTICKAALQLFEKVNLRDIRPSDIEAFKTLRMATPVQKHVDFTIRNGRRTGGYYVPVKEREPATVERE